MPNPRLKPTAASALILGLIPGLIPGLLLAASGQTHNDSPVHSSVALVIHAQPLATDIPRIGLNLGQWTAWGAEQLSRNVLKNPGFEGVVDRTLVRATQVHRHGFSDDQGWLARPDGFWTAARFEVLTGAASGRHGRILDSLASNARGLPEYRIASPIADLADGDIIALTRIRDDLPPARWWLPEAGAGHVRPNSSLVAPGSPGVRSLRLQPNPGDNLRLVSHLDNIGERAGKLLRVQGDWRLGLWVHGAATGEATLRVRWHRHGSPPFIDLRHPVQPGWHYLEHRFAATDDGPVGPLEFILDVRGGTVHLDDVWLGPSTRDAADSIHDTGLARQTFNPHLITLLQRLRPGYLRDWQGQLGDTLDNRLAPPFARRTTRYRPGDSDFGYGLPEFLDLNRLVGAQPWLILPTTFGPDEARALGAWLADSIAEYGFAEIVVEFGNENWNAIFRPAGIQDPHHHGAAADRLFVALREGAAHHPAIRTAINAQYVNPYAALRMARASQHADILALAPYFLYRLDAGDRNHVSDALFAGDGGHMAEILAQRPPLQDIAAYEINLHTTRGDMPRAERDAVVTSNTAGVALAWHLLQHLNRGVRRQNVYRVIGYDTFLQDRSDLTRLFGITRDLGPPATLRPTGNAVELLNRVIGGDLHPITIPEPHRATVTASAFRHEQGWTVALVSTSAKPQTLRLQFPDDGAAVPTLPQRLGQPEAAGIATIHVAGRVLELVLPPFSLLTLQPAPDVARAPHSGLHSGDIGSPVKR